MFNQKKTGETRMIGIRLSKKMNEIAEQRKQQDNKSDSKNDKTKKTK